MANTAVFGIYPTYELAESAVSAAWTDRAKKILVRTGAEDVASAGEVKGDFANSEPPSVR
ncbi:MAG TPA: hypothetical protein VES67_09760 [Vicinamibacterales bacterium]|nr:hypothetical protein [Vicinamibacterales bacterium]